MINLVLDGSIMKQSIIILNTTKQTIIGKKLITFVIMIPLGTFYTLEINVFH